MTSRRGTGPPPSLSRRPPSYGHWAESRSSPVWRGVGGSAWHLTILATPRDCWCTRREAQASPTFRPTFRPTLSHVTHRRRARASRTAERSGRPLSYEQTGDEGERFPDPHARRGLRRRALGSGSSLGTFRPLTPIDDVGNAQTLGHGARVTCACSARVRG